MILSERQHSKAFLSLRMIMWWAILALILIPMIVMQFSAEMHWGWEDFASAILLLCGLGLATEVAARFINRPAARIMVVLVLIGSVVLVWAEAAIGVF